MSTPSHPTVTKYVDLYRKLYQRDPKDVRILNSEFVMVNDTQIRISDLDLLIEQLEQEYRAEQKKKRSTIMKLIGWFRN